ncbi:hypothetical protein MAR_037954 [Mya arenaria]|uniref:Tyr recombinase domain-containing protein n=1 Tax=Mya arenaria TaxID=6604 RepID=A0ABY7FQH9_MYAAR|nr:hypothetical protein MAR_037954 [Mya arenaria]
MQIQIDANDISDTELAEENVLPPPDFTSMFDTDSNNNQVSSEFGWTMPKLKAPEMGEPVSEPLAKLSNVASTKQCEMDGVVTKYKVPSNCDLATPPTVNQEIWKIMNKRGHLNDKLMVDIQNLVAAGIGSVLKLVNLLKDQSLGTEAKGVLSDTLTILCQTQYNLSMRRRYMIRPVLKKKYAGLCNLSTEVMKKLFGDHIDKEIKSCETLSSIGKDSYPQRGTFARGRGRFQQRRGGYGSYYQPRYQPYEQYRPRGAGSWRGSSPKRSIESSVGKLKLYVDQWKNYTNDPWIINAVSGYKIDFVKQPYQGKVPHEIPFDGEKWEIVNDEVNSLLEKEIMTDTLESLGFVLNREKSVLKPCLQILFFGFILDSVDFKVYLTERKMQKILLKAKILLSEGVVVIRDLASFIGLIVNAFYAVFEAKLHFRDLERNMIKGLEGSMDFDKKVQLSDFSILELKWWLNNVETKHGKLIRPMPVHVICRTDASFLGYGGIDLSSEKHTNGRWASEEKHNKSINYLELLPRHRDLLTLAHYREEHPLGRKLRLIAATVSGKHSKVEVFRENLLISSSSHGTRKQYQHAWRHWGIWNDIRCSSAFQTSETVVLTYLFYLHKSGKSYSVINTHKAMLLCTLPFFGNSWCKNTDLISRFIRSVFISKPPKPRYIAMWDVSIVLRFLESLGKNSDLSLKILTFKTVALVALAIAPRAQTLISLCLNNMIVEKDAIVFMISDILKTTAHGDSFSVRIEHFRNESLCAMHTLLDYIEATKKKVTTSTIARWLKLTLSLAGIDTEVFKAHSFRGAATSAAFNRGYSLKSILKTANWKSDKNFRKFYYRQCLRKQDISFSNALFTL